MPRPKAQCDATHLSSVETLPGRQRGMAPIRKDTRDGKQMTGPPPTPSRHGRNSVRDVRIGGGLYLCRLTLTVAGISAFPCVGSFSFETPVAFGAVTIAPMPAHDVLLLIMRCFWPTLERPQNAQPPRSLERPVKRGGDDFLVDAHDISLGQWNHPFCGISLPAGREGSMDRCSPLSISRPRHWRRTFGSFFPALANA